MLRLLFSVFLIIGLAAPALAADDTKPAPPPDWPMDWSDIIGEPDPDFDVGEEMC